MGLLGVQTFSHRLPILSVQGWEKEEKKRSNSVEGEALRASTEFLRGLVPLLTGGCCLPEEAQDDEGRKSSGNVHSCLSPWGAIGGSAPGHWTPPLTPSWGGGCH